MIVDNLVAYRVLSMMVKPFVETDAYKLGIIDDQGNNLIKSNKFTTVEQKDAYTYLHRLVFNVKKLINKLPGGENLLKNMVAGFYLVRESLENGRSITNDSLNEIYRLLDSGVVLVEEQIIVEDFLLCEEAPANATGAAVSTDQPVIRKKPRRFARFIVNDSVYHKMSNGKAKFRKWAEYLNLEDEGEAMIYNFAKKNPNGVIVLQNGTNSRAIRFNHKGGGSWGSIKRKPNK